MGKRMRMLIIYYFCVICLAICAMAVYHWYNVREQVSVAEENLQKSAVKTSEQLDNLIDAMDYSTLDLLSNQQFIPSLATLDYLNKASQKDLTAIAETKRDLQSALYKYSLVKYFYRVNVFTREGSFAASRVYRSQEIEVSAEKVQSIGWLDKADALQGKLLIIPPHHDPWTTDEGELIFSVARAVPGYIMTWGESEKLIVGYIEVQKKYTDFVGVFIPLDSPVVSTVALTGGNTLLYSDKELKPGELEWIVDCASNPGLREARLPGSGDDVLVYSHHSINTGLDTIYIQRRADILSVTNRSTVFLAMAMVIVIASIVYLMVFQRMIAKPIRILKAQMEETELHNLPERTELDSPNDEIEALNLSYQLLKQRLGQAVGQELHARSLQMQANLDALQAQIDPHFMYNILNVLSQQGLESNNERICEICAKIASMLRYSTSTSERHATIALEVEHVRSYLMLMKQRFEHNLEFCIEIPEEIMNAVIPKIVLQPLAENALEHGFEQKGGLRRICIDGSLSDGYWHIVVRDNGQGFPEDKLNEFRERFADLCVSYLSGAIQEMAIGGMGLQNTYMRLLLFFRGDFIMEIVNLTDGGGCEVRLSAPLSQ